MTCPAETRRPAAPTKPKGTCEQHDKCTNTSGHHLHTIHQLHHKAQATTTTARTGTKEGGRYEWRTYVDGSWTEPEENQPPPPAGAGLVTFRMSPQRNVPHSQQNTIEPDSFPLDQRTMHADAKKGRGFIHHVRAWQVETDPLAPGWIGARKSTNNTGEITALVEAMEMAITRGTGAGREEISSDSLYAINMTTGKWMPKREINQEIIWHARVTWQKLQDQRPREVDIVHVRSHTKVPGNEVADRLTDIGAQMNSATVIDMERWMTDWLENNPTGAPGRPPG